MKEVIQMGRKFIFQFEVDLEDDVEGVNTLLDDMGVRDSDDDDEVRDALQEQLMNDRDDFFGDWDPTLSAGDSRVVRS